MFFTCFFIQKNMKAIVIGGSGATGKELINQLIMDDSYLEIKSFVRRKSNLNHPKLKEIVIDFDKIYDYKNEMIGDVAFSCLGTTLKAAGSKEAQWIIDYDYQYHFAQISKENHVSTFVLISSFGANKDSKIFYSKMKGKLEAQVLKLDFNRTIIFQPPSLIRPNSDRNGEIIGMKVIRFFNNFGIFKSFEPLHVTDLAKAMIQSVKQLSIENHIIKPSDIKKLLPNS